MLNNIFTVRPSNITRFDPKGAVELFRDLLYAEARRKGIALNNIIISTRIDVPDDGIDAEITNISTSQLSDLIPDKNIGYQIKAGVNFKPWRESVIKKELFGSRKQASNQNLKSHIKECLDKDGTYIIVCFQHEISDQKSKSIQILKDNLNKCDYSNPKVDIWGYDTLIELLKPFPSLCLCVNQRDGAKFQTHASWGKDIDMTPQFFIGEEHEKIVGQIRDELKNSSKPTHIRVLGEPGIGKTKIVFESTNTEDLAGQVLYCVSPTALREDGLLDELLKTDNEYEAILIVDECDPNSRADILNKFMNRNHNIKIITIYHEFENLSSPTRIIEIPNLNNEQIGEILQSYGHAKDQTERWIGLCGGSPRYAHVIGFNLKENPKDILKTPDNVNIWERHIIGGDSLSEKEKQERLLVLQTFSLFKRVGCAGPYQKEKITVKNIVQKLDNTIVYARFQNIVKTLKSRKILQGEHFLYITPKALQIHLWKQWFELYGDITDWDDFIKEIPDSLRHSFYDMFQYAAESKIATDIVKELLEGNGPFKDIKYIRTSEGATFFFNLTNANPKLALKYLTQALGQCSKEELLGFKEGRREIIGSLLKIAIWRSLFKDAARLLLSLGEAENEKWANNASGVFADLFSLAPGRVAPTEAPPKERFPLLTEALGSSSKERRLLALKAFDKALESQHFVRDVGAEYQGLRSLPNLWQPNTYGEWHDAYRSAWSILSEKIDDMPSDEQEKAVDILLSHSRGLVILQSLSQMVIDTLINLKEGEYANNEEILSTIESILHYEKDTLKKDTFKKLDQIRDELTNKDFHSKLLRYVSMILVEDSFDDKGKHVDKVQPHIEQLAQQVVENHELLEPEYKWLFTTKAKNGSKFGYEIAKKDAELSLLQPFIDVQGGRALVVADIPKGEEISIFFLGGYFRRLFEKYRERWEQELDKLALDERMQKWVPELTSRTGVTDKAVIRVLELLENGIITPSELRRIWFGSGMEEISEKVFLDWINALLEKTDIHATSLALDSFYYYYIHKGAKHKLPQKSTLNLLTHQTLYENWQSIRSWNMDGYRWSEIGKAYIKAYPKHVEDLANVLLQHFGEDDTIFGGYQSRTEEVLFGYVKDNPKKAWKQIQKYLGPPIDTKAFFLSKWLRGGEQGTVIKLIPPDELFKWVDEDVENRAWYLASMVPNSLFHETGIVCLAREVLVRYGKREDVQNELHANFFTEVWSGLSSVHYREKKEQLIEYQKNEDNGNVTQWIDQYIGDLDERIKQSVIQEEKECIL